MNLNPVLGLGLKLYSNHYGSFTELYKKDHSDSLASLADYTAFRWCFSACPFPRASGDVAPQTLVQEVAPHLTTFTLFFMRAMSADV